MSKADTLQYRFTYRKVNIIGTPLVSPELIPLLSQPVNVGFFSMSFIQDKRDDPIDSHHGTYTSIDLALASSAFGSETSFGRVVARNSSYYQLTKDLVLARTTDFGIIERYAGLSVIPLAERFFGGGAFSNRAFPDFQAGPRDPSTGFPIGGNALFTNTVELRFPLIGDNLGGVLFNDLGNVYSAVNKISLRFRQENLQDFDYAVQGFGFGLRYRTPLGPVRVDFSLSPNSPRFFGCEGSINQLIPMRCPRARLYLRPCSASTSSNSISRWDKRFDEGIQNSEFRIQNPEECSVPFILDSDFWILYSCSPLKSSIASSSPSRTK